MHRGGKVLSKDQRVYEGIKLGHGFTLIPYLPLFSNGSLIEMPEGCLDVLIAMSIHADSNKICIASLSRLAILAGVGDATRDAAIDWLKLKNWIEQPDPLVRKYKLKFLTITNKKECFPVFQAFVTRGIWSKLSPSAKKILIILLHKSEAFTEDLDRLPDDEYEYAVSESCKDEGFRMILGQNIDYKLFGEVAGIQPRTMSEAMRELISGEIIEPDDMYSRIISSNVPELIYPDVIDRIKKARRADQCVKPGVRSSLSKHADRRRSDLATGMVYARKKA